MSDHFAHEWEGLRSLPDAERAKGEEHLRHAEHALAEREYSKVRWHFRRVSNILRNNGH